MIDAITLMNRNIEILRQLPDYDFNDYFRITDDCQLIINLNNLTETITLVVIDKAVGVSYTFEIVGHDLRNPQIHFSDANTLLSAYELGTLMKFMEVIQKDIHNLALINYDELDIAKINDFYHIY